MVLVADETSPDTGELTYDIILKNIIMTATIPNNIITDVIQRKIK